MTVYKNVTELGGHRPRRELSKLENENGLKAKIVVKL